MAFVVLLGGVAGLWAFLVLEPSRRRNGRYQLEPPESASHDITLKPGHGPRVAIICPGRNEGHWIKQTLPELCQQQGVDYRVVYVDDHSDDDTPQVTACCEARYPHLMVVRNQQEPPPGWVGKPWAVHQGYQALCKSEAPLTPGDSERPADWLCLTDADIHWHPRCLAVALEHAAVHDADLVALFPGMRFGTVAERLGVSTMVLALGLIFPFEKAMDPKTPRTLTGGAFMLVRRSLYEKIGGHRSVANQMVEDVNLGMNLKAAGAKVRIAATRQLLYGRMYEGWSDMWEGLTKNAYAGMGYRPHYALVMLTATLLANVLPPIYLLVSLGWLMAGGGWLAGLAAGLAALTLGLQAWAMRWVCRITDLHAGYLFSVPVGSAIYSLFIVGSVWRYYRGGNVWKGRRYDAAALRGVDG